MTEMTQQTTGEEWVMVYRAREGWQAALAQGFLQDAGIPAVQMNPNTDLDVWTGAPEPSRSGVRVPASYAAAAGQVLERMLPKA